MKTKIRLKVLLWISISLAMQSLYAFAQGTFANLNFESALVPDTPPQQGGQVSPSLAFPGWVVIPGQDGLILHNVTPIGSPSVVLLGPTWSQTDILEGNYTADLYSAPINIGSAIAQIGQIPVTAQSMLFYAQVFNMSVSFAGNSLPFYQVGSGSNYGIFGVDMRALSGMTGELRFNALPLAGGGVGGVRLAACRT